MDVFAPLLQYLISVLTNGAIYALIALGFGIIFNSTTIIYFAQGEMVMLGALSAISVYHLQPSLPLAFLGGARKKKLPKTSIPAVISPLQVLIPRKYT